MKDVFNVSKGTVLMFCLILSSSTTRLLTVNALLTLCSDISITLTTINIINTNHLCVSSEWHAAPILACRRLACDNTRCPDSNQKC